MGQGDDPQHVSYRDYFKIQYDSLQRDINNLKMAIGDLGKNVPTKGDIFSVRDLLHEKITRVERDATDLKKALEDLEKTVSLKSDREIAAYRRILFAMGAGLLTVVIAWVKVSLGL